MPLHSCELTASVQAERGERSPNRASEPGSGISGGPGGIGRLVLKIALLLAVAIQSGLAAVPSFRNPTM
jgi:hypothetical protein